MGRVITTAELFGEQEAITPAKKTFTTAELFGQSAPAPAPVPEQPGLFSRIAGALTGPVGEADVATGQALNAAAAAPREPGDPGLLRGIWNSVARNAVDLSNSVTGTLPAVLQAYAANAPMAPMFAPGLERPGDRIPLQAAAKAAAQRSADIQDFGQAYKQRNFRENPVTAPGYLELLNKGEGAAVGRKLLEETAGMAVQFAPALIAAALSGGMAAPLVAGTVGGTQEGLGQFNEAIAEGKATDEALRESVAFGGLTAALNAIPFARALDKIAPEGASAGRRTLARVIRALLEGATETAEGGAQPLAELDVPAQQLPTEIAKGLWRESTVFPAAALTGGLIPGGEGEARPDAETEELQAIEREAIEQAMARRTKPPTLPQETRPVEVAVVPPIAPSVEQRPAEAAVAPVEPGASVIPTKETSHAIIAGQEPRGNREEHRGVEGLRPELEASRGDRAVESGEVQKEKPREEAVEPWVPPADLKTASREDLDRLLQMIPGRQEDVTRELMRRAQMQPATKRTAPVENEAIAEFRAMVRRHGIKPPTDMTYEDFGGPMPVGIWKKSATRSWDDWAQEAEEMGLLQPGHGPEDLRNLLVGKLTPAKTERQISQQYEEYARGRETEPVSPETKPALGETERTESEQDRAETEQDRAETEQPAVVNEGQLEPGDFVRLGGEWHRVEEKTADGTLLRDGENIQVGNFDDLPIEEYVPIGHPKYETVKSQFGRQEQAQPTPTRASAELRETVPRYQAGTPQIEPWYAPPEKAPDLARPHKLGGSETYYRSETNPYGWRIVFPKGVEGGVSYGTALKLDKTFGRGKRFAREKNFGQYTQEEWEALPGTRPSAGPRGDIPARQQDAKRLQVEANRLIGATGAKVNVRVVDEEAFLTADEALAYQHEPETMEEGRRAKESGQTVTTRRKWADINLETGTVTIYRGGTIEDAAHELGHWFRDRGLTPAESRAVQEKYPNDPMGEEFARDAAAWYEQNRDSVGAPTNPLHRAYRRFVTFLQNMWRRVTGKDVPVEEVFRRIYSGEMAGREQGQPAEATRAAVGDRLSDAEPPIDDVEPARMETRSGGLIPRIQKEFMSWPESVTAADGTEILLHNPQGERLSKRALHLVWDSTKEQLHLEKAAWLPNVPQTLENASARLVDLDRKGKETGNRVYVRAYKDGTKHLVVVRPDRTIEDQRIVHGRLITQFPYEGGGRQDNFRIDWEREKGEGIVRGNPNPALPASPIPASQQKAPTAGANQQEESTTPDEKPQPPTRASGGARPAEPPEERQPVPEPELTGLAKALTGVLPEVRRTLPGALGRFRYKEGIPQSKISLLADIFIGPELKTRIAKTRPTATAMEKMREDIAQEHGLDPEDVHVKVEYNKAHHAWEVGAYQIDPNYASTVLAHEIGHAVDWLPDYTTKRGNILGHVATLRGYLKGTLENAPETTAELITAKERARLHSKAQAAARKLVDPRRDRSGFAKEVKDQYRTLVDALIKERGLWSRDELTNELKDLAKWWRKESAIGGKMTSKELYADALSVLLNEPESLRQRAPKFYEAWENYLSRKPQAQAELDAIQEEIRKGNLPENRLSDYRAMMQRGQELRTKMAESRQEEHRVTVERFIDSLTQAFVNRDVAVTKYVRAKKKAGEQIPPERDPELDLRELVYFDSTLNQFTRDVQEQVRSLATDEELGVFMGLRRAATERKLMADPLGIRGEHAEETLKELDRQLGPEKAAKVREAEEAWWKLRQKYLFPALERSGLFSSETLDMIKSRREYAKFNVQKYMEERGGGTGVTSKLYRQVGTMQEIANPFVETVLQDMSMMKAALMNQAKRDMIDVMGDDAAPAKRVWRGDRYEFQEPPNRRKQGMIVFSRDGETQAAYVDKAIADAFEREPVTAHFWARMFVRAGQPVKALLTTYEPGWIAWNLQRDYQNTLKNLPGNVAQKPFRLAASYGRVLRDAWADAIHDKSTPLARDMYEANALLAGRTWRAKDILDDESELDRLADQFSLRPESQAHWWERFILKPLERAGVFTERLGKMAAWDYLERYVPKMDVRKRAEFVRTRAASPDFKMRGSATAVTNNVFMFSNATVQGWRASLEAFKDDPKNRGASTVLYSLLPKALIAAAAYGFLGDDLEKLFAGVPTSDRMKYWIFPWGRTNKGETVYTALPMDHEGQLVGALVNTMFQQIAEGRFQPTEYAKAVGAEVPDKHPLIQVIQDYWNYLQGMNPVDTFRNQPAMDEATFQAGGLRGAKELAKYEWNNLFSQFYRFKHGPESAIRSEFARKMSIPVVGPIMTRFLRVSNKGLEDTLRRAKSEVVQQEAKNQLQVRDMIWQSLNGLPENASLAEQRRESNRIYRESRQKGILPQGYKPDDLWARYHSAATIYRYGTPEEKLSVGATKAEKRAVREAAEAIP